MNLWSPAAALDHIVEVSKYSAVLNVTEERDGGTEELTTAQPETFRTQ